jgi:hypothetical protein
MFLNLTNVHLKPVTPALHWHRQRILHLWLLLALWHLWHRSNLRHLVIQLDP